MPAIAEDVWLQIQAELTEVLSQQEQERPGLALLQEQLRTLQLNRSVDGGIDSGTSSPVIDISGHQDDKAAGSRNPSHIEEAIMASTPAAGMCLHE